MAPTVLLLDIDGTLVDNTQQHIAAWGEALKQPGKSLDRETLRRNIGKGGDLFVKAVAGEGWDREHGDQARDRHGKAYKKRMDEVRPVSGAVEFLQGVRDLKIRPVLASSSNPDEVKANLAVLGEMPEDFLIVDKDDIQTSKPAPDVFAIALERSGSAANRAAAVGAARWDGQAARRVGVTLYGVWAGAGTREELVAGGAERVFSDLRSLLAFLKRR